MRTSTLHRRGGAAALGVLALTLSACGAAAAGQGAAAPALSAPQPMPAPTQQAAGGAATAVVVGERATGSGEVLVDSTGRTLYTFALDHGGHSACSGACATAWPPLIVPSGDHLTSRVPLPGRLAMIVRADGSMQASYDGRPLYAFVGDHAPGQTHGQGVKGVWFVARVDGRRPAPVTSPPVTRTPVPAPPTMQPAPSNPIPQGGGGDGDGDNSGGASDGDGNV